MRALRVLCMTWLAVIPATGFAAPPKLALPIDCEIGPDCFVQNYVDHRAGKEYQDYHCGFLTNDGHRGTDFRLRDHGMMEAGVAVVAAAAGTVQTTRDGMPDVDFRLVGRESVTDRGLGNAVVIDHGGGWKTLYGHMKRGSVAVSKGQTVKAGQKLGLVGLSGLTEFPHVHFGVKFGKRNVDPFVGLATHTGCGPGEKSMWRQKTLAALTYRPTVLLRAGFADRPMKRTAMQYGLYDRNILSRKRGNLHFGVFVAGLYPGDRFQLTLMDSTGKKFRDGSSTVTKPASVQFRSLAHTQATPLPAGQYRARFRLYRTAKDKTAPIIEIERTVTLR